MFKASSCRYIRIKDRSQIQFNFTLCVIQAFLMVFFLILVLQEYWVLTESRIPDKLVLGGVRIIALSISFHEQTQ